MPNDLKQWVLVSSFLDLWQDEEGRTEEDINEILAPEVRDDFFRLRMSCPIGALLVLKDGVAEPAVTPPTEIDGSEAFWKPLTDELAADAWDRFLNIKGARIAVNLSYSRRCLAFAEAFNGIRQEEAEALEQAHAMRGRWLDRIAGFCAAALFAIENMKDGLGFSKADRDTLWMLFHSELCAAATPDVSLAYATSARPGDHRDAACDALFEDIIRHNRARGHLHARKYHESAAVLDLWVDGYAAPAGPFGDTGRDKDLWNRLVYFPGIVTLADSFQHMHRLSEAEYYLDVGRRLSPVGSYWARYFDLLLREMRPWDVLAVEAAERRPRLRHRQVMADSTRRERALLLAALAKRDLAGATKWAMDLTWTLRWHFADPEETFLRRLQGACEAVGRLAQSFRALKTKPLPLGALRLVPVVVRDLTERRHSGGCVGFLRFLSLDRLPPPKSHRILWDALNALLAALDEEKGIWRLDTWAVDLRRRAGSSANIEQLSKTVAQSLLLTRMRKIGSIECPLAPGKLTAGDCTHAAGCAVDALLNPNDKVADADKVADVDYCLATMAANNEQYRSYLEGETAELRKLDDPGKGPSTPLVEFISLRRWNSFSPNLNSLSTATVGGGYLVRVWHQVAGRYVGIAVDPGYNYLQNLFNEGFTVADLDVVVVTHAHPDHTDNLSNILTLLREQKKRAEDKRIKVFGRPVSVVISEGAFVRLAELLENERDFVREVVVVSWSGSPGNEAGRQKVRMSATDGELALSLVPVAGASPALAAEMWAVPAYHEDGTRRDSIGVRIEASGHSIGIISDSRYQSGLAEPVKDCDVVVAHVGAILDQKQYDGLHLVESQRRGLGGHLRGADHTCSSTDAECARHALYNDCLLKKNHLYFPGLTKFLCDLAKTGKPPLVVLSEFGEEMRGGLRIDLAKRAMKAPSKPNDLHCVPADVGLRIDLAEKGIRCAVCSRYVFFKEVDPVVASAADEAISYVCKTCQLLRAGELRELLLRARTHLKPLKKIPTQKTAEAAQAGQTRAH